MPPIGYFKLFFDSGDSSYLDEPHRAVACDDPVCQQPDHGKINLAAEVQEEGEHAHDVDVHAVDLNDPEACGMRILCAPGLVILQKH